MSLYRIFVLCCLCAILTLSMTGCTYHEHYYTGQPVKIECDKK